MMDVTDWFDIIPPIENATQSWLGEKCLPLDLWHTAPHAPMESHHTLEANFNKNHMSFRRQKLLARVNWYPQSSLKTHY